MSVQFRQLCHAITSRDSQLVDRSLLSGTINSLSVAELLLLIEKCIEYDFWKHIFILFDQALTIKGVSIAELTAVLDHPKLMSMPSIKRDLIQALVKTKTDSVELLSLGLLYRDHDLFDSAEQLFLQLVEKTPNDIRIFHRLISVYIRMQRYHDAIACCQLALELNENSLTAHYNLGVAQLALNHDSQALAAFSHAVTIDPKNHWAHINIATIVLKHGNFKQGWEQYEWRKKFHDSQQNDIARFIPEWTGQTLFGKTLLLCADQGLGDTVMYAGFISRVVALGAQLSVVAEPRLKSLLMRSFPIVNFYENEITQEQFSSHSIGYHISFSGLGRRFIQSFDDFYPRQVYLKSQKNTSQKIRKSLLQTYGDKQLVGISWRGGVVDTKKYARQIELRHWRPLLLHKEYLFVNLQYDSTPAEQAVIEKMGAINIQLDHFGDVDAVANVLDAMDLLISVDNSTAHIAAALGKSVWNLLPFSSDWRWFTNSDTGFWYQDMRLFRQQNVNDWQHCIAAVDHALTNLNPI